MATGYIRTDVSNEISNGSFIDADDLDAEFDGVEAAFHANTGHAHDGTTGNGGPITKIGPAQDLVTSSTQVLPKTSNTLDLGSSGSKFKDGYFDGVVYSDGFTGPLTGAVTGNAATATALQTARTFDITGQIDVDAVSFDGTGNVILNIVTLSASNLNAGTVPSGRMTGVYNGITGTGALIAGSIGSGFGNINIGANSFTGNGSGITSINASNISSGVLSNDRMPLNISVSSVAAASFTASGNITGNIVHQPDGGYLRLGSYSIDTYGNGRARIWYNHNDETVVIQSDSGNATVTAGAFSGSGAALTSLNASNLSSGTIANGRVSGSYTGITGTGVLNTGSISSGFGSINIGSSIFTGNGSGLTALNASNVSTGTLSGSRMGDHSADLLTTGTVDYLRLPTSAGANDWVRTRIAGNTAYEIGMSAWLLGPSGSSVSAGDTSSGSTLRLPYLRVNVNNNSLVMSFAGSGPSGSWRAMQSATVGSDERPFLQYMRYA